MIKTTAIKLPNLEPMSVTWDVGRRCNYDCTYCESTRHDLVSPLHSLDELKKTFDFIKEWSDVYNKKRRIPSSITINFTGGEPTVNPAFWELCSYIKETDPSINLGLTTNGAWSPKNTNKIIELFNGVTVSYHAEAHPTLKQKVLENIKLLHQSNIWLQVNVMLHVDYFEECIKVCEDLKSLGIRHNPRPIGDGNVEGSGWRLDADGSMRRTSHAYNETQQTWFFNYIGSPNSSQNKKEGTDMGRVCCGGRCTIGKVNNDWKEVKLIDTHFKEWHCMVDWYFLHIDQHTGLVYHHQTCQALLNKKRGALGHISEKDVLIENLKNKLSQDVVEHIICPNDRCGCGMCVPKAKEFTDFEKIADSLTNIKFNR